jgi:uncharacterized protein (TIGR02594 family)
MTSTLIGGSVGKGGLNKLNDVRAVQTLLNLPINMSLSGLKAPLKTDGRLGKGTQDAIDLYQEKVMKPRKGQADGRVDRGGSMIVKLEQGLPPMPALPFSKPKRLQIASDEAKTGVQEKSGRADNNPRILEYLSSFTYLSELDDKIKVKDATGKKVDQKTGYKMSEVDETAWCACFVNWCLVQAGEAKGKNAGAKSWQTYGKGGDAMTGNICVIEREPFGDSGSGWHVGFFLAGDPKAGYVALLGGNQGNRVCRRWFVGLKSSAQRWPG